MEITLKDHRYRTIYNWKRLGLIHDDYDELYTRYINTLECEHCLKVFTTTRDRCMDHDHVTGEFRKIVCQKCNCWDGYIRYPNGYTEEDLKENARIYKKRTDKQQYTCDCGGVYKLSHKSHHIKTKKHLKYLENNLENK